MGNAPATRRKSPGNDVTVAATALGSSTNAPSELDEFLQSTLSSFERDSLNSTSLDDRVQHLMESLRRKGVLPATSSDDSSEERIFSTKKLFEPGIVSTEKYEWCSPRSDQLLLDLEAMEAFDSLSHDPTSSPRLRLLRDLSWSVRGSFWEDQVKRSLLFSFLQRRWSNDALVRTSSSYSNVPSSGGLFATAADASSLASTTTTNTMNTTTRDPSLLNVGFGFHGVPGTGMPSYARM